MQQDGADGAPVFASWHDLLCGFADTPACTVTAIQQTLIEANAVFTLTVSYAIEDPSTIVYREFHVGPLPLATLAACGDGQMPTVEVLQTALIGRDANGDQMRPGEVVVGDVGTRLAGIGSRRPGIWTDRHRPEQQVGHEEQEQDADDSDKPVF
jgi:hypothetical protein